jgi:hypothetical protein
LVANSCSSARVTRFDIGTSVKTRRDAVGWRMVLDQPNTDRDKHDNHDRQALVACHF